MNKVAERHFKRAAINLDERWWAESFSTEFSSEQTFVSFMNWQKVLWNYETLGKVTDQDYVY